MRTTASIALCAFVTSVSAFAGQTPAGPERFEVSSVRSVRPTLVNTITALQKRDIPGARDAFDAFDSGWNGVEVYINVRYPEMYKELEGNLETRIIAGLNAPSPDMAALLADAKTMLAKFDETIALLAAATPLNRLYDDVTRLRIVRAHLREVTPALKAGKVDKARASFNAFNENWDSIEDLVRERSREAYVAIESGMIAIEQAFMPAQPNTEAIVDQVADVMGRYNAIVAEVNKEARSAK